MSDTTAVNSQALNRAKQWQVALFPFNNAATNVYFAFYNYFTYFAIMYLTGSATTAISGAVVSGGLVLVISTFTSLFVPLMRVFDGITDPPIGSIIDKTQTKLGKFRPFMIIGNSLLALSLLLMMVFFVGVKSSAVRWVVYIVSYFVYVIGYTCQCAVTKAGQTCLTNDPKQRSQFAIWNMIGTIFSIVLINVLAGGILTNESICAKGVITYTENGVVTELKAAAYGLQFYQIMVPIVIGLSAIYTIMAIAAISSKDKPEFWGLPGKPVKFKEYVDIFKHNKAIRWLVLSSGLNKLASTIGISTAVMFLLFGGLMGDYNGLFIPFYVLCFIFMGIFMGWGTKTASKKGQKRTVTQFTALALLFYVGVLIMLAIYDNGNASTYLSIYKITDNKFTLTLNAYTIIFIIVYGCGYGAFNCCDQMTIPMVADCTDYETYRSGNYVPGIMGTIFSLVDKVISSLQTLLLQLFIVFMIPELNALPGEDTVYMEGMKLATIFTFCIIPMITWIVTLICMYFYKLNASKMEEIQAVNAVRKAAINGGMDKEEALQKWVTIDQVPQEFIPNKTPETASNLFDKIYNKIWGRNEEKELEASSNAIEIPQEYRL